MKISLMTKCWNAKANSWASENSFWINFSFLFLVVLTSLISHVWAMPFPLYKSYDLTDWRKVLMYHCVWKWLSCFLCLNCQYYIMAETYFFLRHCQTFVLRDESFYPAPWNRISQIRRWEITTKAKSNCRNMQNGSFQCSQTIWKCW